MLVFLTITSVAICIECVASVASTEVASDNVVAVLGTPTIVVSTLISVC